MNTPIFYHYLPSGEFVSDGFDGVESEYEPKGDGVAIKKLYTLDSLSNISVSSDEEEEDLLDAVKVMEEIDLDRVPLPSMVWTSIKYKPSQVAQFISLVQNKSYKLPRTAKETGIDYTMAYQFNKQWKANRGIVLPDYKLTSEVKSKRNNIKITDEQSKFIEDYVEAHPTCIVKDVIEQLCVAFGDLSVNESTVYRHNYQIVISCLISKSMTC